MTRLAVVLVLLLILSAIYPVLLLVRSTRPEVSIDPLPKAVATATSLKLRIANPHGFRSASVWLEQDGARQVVMRLENPARRWEWTVVSEPPRSFDFTAAATKDGKAKLIAEVVSNDLRGATVTAAYDVVTITRPPSVVTDSARHFVIQGGCDLVTFTPSGVWTEAGVRAGPYTAKSYPKAAGGTRRFSLYAFPWDLPASVVPVVFARTEGGPEVTASFQVRVLAMPSRKRSIEIDDAFIDKVTADIDPGGSGDRLERFLRINRDLRLKNNQALAGLRTKTVERLLWSGPFLQLARSQVESHFADVRSYLYRGKKVDEQVHLGFDLSAVQRAPVVAANDGIVVFGERLGIYGNCIVVDHGYGLQSIYGHLSTIGVKPGDAVRKGQEIGRSGSTGLAGGDHLHFSMQLDGVQVNPLDWWDAKRVEGLLTRLK